MAVVISRCLEEKYSAYRTEPADEESAARAKAGSAWARKSKMWIESGKTFTDDNGFAVGKRVPEEYFTGRVRFTRGSRLYDYNSYVDNWTSVSQRFKDLVEAVEPGVHQFVPVEVFYQDGSRYPDPVYYFVICTVLDAINPDRGGVYKQHRFSAERQPDDYVWTIKSGGFKSLAVYKDRIAGHAFWHDARYQRRRFVSDAMLARMTEAGLEGYEIETKWEEI